jgi:hypothetical protein
MGFWYADTDDRTGSWHWNGIAISLCQTIGLHRKPDIGQRCTKVISVKDRRLWRQLWWSCYYRETWLSIGIGRPMRINLDDCDTPMVDASDCNELLVGIADHVREIYVPESIEELSESWVELLRLTVSLGNILSVYYRARPAQLPRTQLEETERQIRLCHHRKDHVTSSSSHTVLLHTYHLELYLE